MKKPTRLSTKTIIVWSCVEDSGEWKSPEHDFKFLYWTISTTFFEIYLPEREYTGLIQSGGLNSLSLFTDSTTVLGPIPWSERRPAPYLRLPPRGAAFRAQRQYIYNLQCLDSAHLCAHLQLRGNVLSVVRHKHSLPSLTFGWFTNSACVSSPF